MDVYLYDDIDWEKAEEVVKELREASSKLSGYDSPQPIKLHISSYGGYMDAGFAIIATMESLYAPVHTYVEGVAASAGNMISVAGKKRYCHANSTLMLHQFSCGGRGPYSKLKEYDKNHDMNHQRVLNHYLKYTKMKKKKLEEILANDVYTTPEEALKLGIIDEIL